MIRALVKRRGVSSRFFASALAFALALSALSIVGLSTSTDAGAAVTTRAFGSVEAAYLTSPTGTVATLFNAAHHVVAVGTSDALGALVIHDVVPGKGYHFSLNYKGKVTTTPSFVVLSQTCLLYTSDAADE